MLTNFQEAMLKNVSLLLTPRHKFARLAELKFSRKVWLHYHNIHFKFHNDCSAVAETEYSTSLIPKPTTGHNSSQFLQLLLLTIQYCFPKISLNVHLLSLTTIRFLRSLSTKNMLPFLVSPCELHVHTIVISLLSLP